MDKPKTTEDLIRLIDDYVYYNNLKEIENIDISEVDSFVSSEMSKGIFNNVNIGENNVLDLSKWDTSKVKDMSFCFADFVGNIKGLDKWDTSNVEDMGYCFSRFKGNFEGIENWKVENVEDINSMFYGIRKDKLDLSNWKFKILEKSRRCFKDSTINELILFDISKNKKTIDCGSMFKEFKGNIIGLDKFDVSKIFSFRSIFYDKKLTKKEKKDICKWKIDKDVYTINMFGEGKDWNWFQKNVCMNFLSKDLHGNFNKKKVVNHIKQRLKELENL